MSKTITFYAVLSDIQYQIYFPTLSYGSGYGFKAESCKKHITSRGLYVSVITGSVTSNKNL